MIVGSHSIKITIEHYDQVTNSLTVMALLLLSIDNLLIRLDHPNDFGAGF